MKLGQKGFLLIVDDDETTCTSLEDILRLEGYHVHSLTSGEEALAFLLEETVDLMILDLKMPGMDGLQVLQIVSKQFPDVIVILLTAYASVESAVTALRQRVFDYLVKPISPQQVLACVQSALAQRADQLHKHSVLEEMEVSLRQLLKTGFSYPSRDQVSPEEPQLVYLGNGVMVDFDRRELWVGTVDGEGRRIRLTPTEAKLLEVLLERVGEVLTHKEIVLLVQGYEVTDWEAPEVLRPLVSRLRQKLANFPGGEHWISNVRGKGYLFERRGAGGA
jgi:DNA-binding response OmpR family regulator